MHQFRLIFHFLFKRKNKKNLPNNSLKKFNKKKTVSFATIQYTYENK